MAPSVSFSSFFFLFLLVVVGVSTQQWGSNPYYYDNWCAQHGLEYLDDCKCQKKFPSSYQREQWKCPIVSTSEQMKGYKPGTAWPNIALNTSALSGLPLLDRVDLTIMLIRRPEDGGAPVFHYLSAGRQDDAFETWSSSKIFAISNAAGTMNAEYGCPGAGGLALDTKGKNGDTPLGDLATIVCSYDTTQGYSSNSLSSYFNDIGGRQKLDNELHEWLGAPSDQSLGGNYGEPSPSDLGFEFFEGTDPSQNCQVNPDHTSGLGNYYSSLSAAEMVRRFVLFQDTAPQNRWPNMTYSDSLDVLYGADPSVFFPGLQWGGMTADPSIFVQGSVNITSVELESGGNWRIFSKLGAGYSGSRNRGEIVNNAYVCFPVVDGEGKPVVGKGHEFIISARSSVPNDLYLYGAQKELHIAMESVVQAVMNNQVN